MTDPTRAGAPPPATLLELLKVLAARPLLLAACVAAGGAWGLVAASRVPPSYEGAVLVRVGQLPQGAGNAEAREPRSVYEALATRMVEPPAVAAERIRTPGFVAAAGLPGAVDEQLAAITVRPVRDTDLLELRYRGRSPEAVEQGLRALLETLRQRHEELAQAGRERARQEPQLLHRHAVLRTAPQPQFTRGTEAVEPIAVARSRREPGALLRTVGGALLGALAAAAVILFRYSARRRASR